MPALVENIVAAMPPDPVGDHESGLAHAAEQAKSSSRPSSEMQVEPYSALPDEFRSIVSHDPGMSLVFSPHGDRADSPHIEIRPMGAKGLGLVASQNFEQYDDVLQEAPLLMLPTEAQDHAAMEELIRSCLAKLCTEDQNYFLHCLRDSTGDAKFPLGGRVRTNCLPCGRKSNTGAIFKYIALANHSCVPNCTYYWDETTGRGVLQATTDIRAGTEITISYIEMAPHDARQARLRSAFGFSCTCGLCSLSKKRRRAEDLRICDIIVLETRLFTDPALLSEDTDRAIADFMTLAGLYATSEASSDYKLNHLWACVADMFVANFDFVPAVWKMVDVLSLPVREVAEMVKVWYMEYEEEA